MEFNEFLDSFDPDTISDFSTRIDSFMGSKTISLDNSIKPSEQLLIALLVDKYNPDVIVETGTNIGVATSVLAMFSKSDCKVYTIDIPGEVSPENLLGDDDNWGIVFKDASFENKIRKIAKNTHTIKNGELPAAEFWFLDSDHSLPTVIKETELALNSGAKVILYHDANEVLPYHSDVYEYLSTLDTSGKTLTFVNTEAGIAILTIN